MFRSSSLSILASHLAKSIQEMSSSSSITSSILSATTHQPLSTSTSSSLLAQIFSKTKLPPLHHHRTFQSMTFPPRPSSSYNRLLSSIRNPDSQKVIWGLIAANSAVYFLWRYDPYFASKHFVVSLDAVRNGRVWTPLTASFSQQDFGHFASNMISLYFFGSDIGRIFGGRKLLVLYLAGGILGSAAHLGWSYYKEQQLISSRRLFGYGHRSQGALGASAAVNAIMLVDILMFPMRTILLYGFIPLPAALLGMLWLYNDLGGAIGGGGHIAHAGHLGGAATGLVFYLAFKRGMIRPSGWW